MNEMGEQPKILMIDIETAPNKVYAWGLFNQNIGINQIVEPGYTISWAANWYGARKKDAEFRSVHHDGADMMVNRAWTLLDEADAVVHFNGKKFDIPTLNREFLMHGYTPPSPYWQIDLLSVVRKEFRFASNKLDYVSKQLGIGAKIENKGMDLWHECMQGDEKAWADMRKYNLQDIHLLPKLYERLLPWITSHPNMALWENSHSHSCPNCGSSNVIQQGYRTTKVSIYSRYKCNDCGKWSRGRKRAFKTADGVLVG